MKPWTIKTFGSKRPDDSFTIPLWNPYKPKDFYFATQWENECNSTIVYIVPKEFYETHSRMYDDSIPIIQHLPNYFEEISEGIYEASRMDEAAVRTDMMFRGFIHDDFFQRWADRVLNV